MSENKEKSIFVKSLSDNKVYLAHAGNLELVSGDKVLFEYDQFQETGVIAEKENVCESGVDDSKVSIIRKLNEKDYEKLTDLKQEAKDTLPACGEKIKKHGLSMDLLDADISYDGKKLTFYFTSPGRVDFRSLVPDLAATFKKLIRLQQVGFRDKARCMEGVGRCGQKFCCCSFLKGNLDDVNTEMAAEQNLGQMGATRVTGSCGKLQCCLKFELPYYKERKKKMPQVGSKHKTGEGEGVVISQNVVKNTVTVEIGTDRKRVEVSC